MITKLTNDQIAIFWPVLKYGVIASSALPGKHNYEEFTNEVLKNALSGKFQIWLAYEKSEEAIQPYAMLISSIMQDGLTGLKYLALENLYSFKVFENIAAVEDGQVIVQFARDTGCKAVRARTAIPRVADMLIQLGLTEYQLKTYNMDL